jgi:hypothetical protein
MPEWYVYVACSDAMVVVVNEGEHHDNKRTFIIYPLRAQRQPCLNPSLYASIRASLLLPVCLITTLARAELCAAHFAGSFPFQSTATAQAKSSLARLPLTLSLAAANPNCQFAVMCLAKWSRVIILGLPLVVAVPMRWGCCRGWRGRSKANFGRWDKS